jgi:hypothetical protein
MRNYVFTVYCTNCPILQQDSVHVTLLSRKEKVAILYHLKHLHDSSCHTIPRTGVQSMCGQGRKTSQYPYRTFYSISKSKHFSSDNAHVSKLFKEGISRDGG